MLSSSGLTLAPCGGRLQLPMPGLITLTITPNLGIWTK